MAFALEIPGYLIRSVDDSSEDRTALLAVYHQCEDFLALGPVSKASPEMVLADLALSRSMGGKFCLIVDPHLDAPVGVVDWVAAGYGGKAGTAYLSLLMIAAPWRGHGVGEAVVRAVEAEIRRDSQVCEIAAGVQVNNPRAVRFWQRMGYQITSEAKRMLDGTICYDLLKVLE